VDEIAKDFFAVNLKKERCMKKFFSAAALLSFFLVAISVSAQTVPPTAWPHGGKYGFGTRYYYLHNYMAKDLIVKFTGAIGFPVKDTFMLKAGKDTIWNVSNNWGAARVWAYWDPKFYNGPYTLAEITQRGYQGSDWYDVSLVDGYNLPMIYKPVPGTYIDSTPLNQGWAPQQMCGTAGCLTDMYLTCPKADLRLDAAGDTEACACQDDSTCRKMKKTACPLAYSYSVDDFTSIMRCPSPTLPDTIGPDYILDFGFPPSESVNKEPTINYSFVDAMAVTMTKHGELKYTYNGASTSTRLTLFSCNGKLVAEATLTGSYGTIHVPTLARGLYFVALKTGEFTKTTRMLVVR
jgi:Thaumatin family